MGAGGRGRRRAGCCGPAEEGPASTRSRGRGRAPRAGISSQGFQEPVGRARSLLSGSRLHVYNTGEGAMFLFTPEVVCGVPGHCSWPCGFSSWAESRCLPYPSPRSRDPEVGRAPATAPGVGIASEPPALLWPRDGRWGGSKEEMFAGSGRLLRCGLLLPLVAGGE